MKKEMMTTKEVAKYLNINEKRVYQLIKDKKIPSTKITGKWLFPKRLIDKWIIDSAKENIGLEVKQKPLQNQVVISGSNDLALELLIKKVNIKYPQYTASISNVGSLGGMVALKNRSCHIAASHLLDPATGEYNISYINKYLNYLDVLVLNLVYRQQGLIVKKGNPLKIKNFRDLVNPKLNFINRQEGSGTRVLFNLKLKEMQIAPNSIKGYKKIAYTHMEVAIEILSGTADVGIGILAIAKLFNLDFIPLSIERFDLIIPKENYNLKPVKALVDVINSYEFKKEVTQIGGYITKDTGKILYQ